MSQRAVRRVAGVAIASALWMSPGLAEAQFCPSYTLSSPNNNNDCGIEAAPGINPSQQEWSEIFDFVSLGPSVWGEAGPTVDDLEAGCDAPTPPADQTAAFPCELMKAIAMVETGWRQFCEPSTPSDQVGNASQTIISFDCGYGIGQITSGMHIGETPDYDRERVAADPVYNLATGTRILASKWNVTACVGDAQPRVIEHWYTATWAYNGLAYSNNPNNPNHDPNRGVYDPAVGGSAPYQEKVFGYVEHPKDELWASVELAYPPLEAIGNENKPPALPEPSCASPTDCARSRPQHETVCGSVQGGGTGGGPSDGGSGGAGGGPDGTGAGGTGGLGPEPTPGADAETSSGSDDGCGCRVVGGHSAELEEGGGAGDARGWMGVVTLLAGCGLLTARRRRPTRRLAGSCVKDEPSW